MQVVSNVSLAYFTLDEVTSANVCKHVGGSLNFSPI